MLSAQLRDDAWDEWLAGNGEFDPTHYLPDDYAAGDDIDEVAIDEAEDQAPTHAIDELRELRQWVAWKIVMRPDKDGVLHPTKPPVCPRTGAGASHSKPGDWDSYENAARRSRISKLAGVGFVLSEDDGYTGVDLDKCRDAETGDLEQWAQEIIDFAETYSEVSPSGTGIRMIVRGKIESTIKCDRAHVELYRSQRYLTITGDHIEGTPDDIRPAPKTLAALIARVEAIKPKTEPQPERAEYRASLAGARLASSSSGGFFRAVNAKALTNIESWVTELFPHAKRQPGTGGWRVSSKDLGRNLQEDISITSDGTVDFGVADMGDPNLGKRTAIDLVIEWGGAPDAKAAALWLCDRMGADPASLGWQDEEDVAAFAKKLFEGEDNEPENGDADGKKKSETRGVELETVNAASLAGKPVPFQRWLVDDLIPEANVTMLSGDGATGKSLLALQLAVATATSGDWIGFKPRPGRVVFVSAEDEIEELHRRLDNMTPRLETLGRLTIVPLAGKDAVLASPARDGLLHPTPLFGALKHIIQTHHPDLLVLDTLADLFGGDEIKKVQARQFIGMLRGIALEHDVAIVLLSHPSLSGMQSGSGMSGNTAWNNSVRSRLYFERRIDKFDGSEDDADIRVLTTKKANRAASGGKITVRYCKGVFMRENSAASNSDDIIHESERVFLKLLAQFEREGRTVSDKPSANWAPKVFAEHHSAEGITKRVLKGAMDRLFAAGRIKIEETGPQSKIRRKISFASAPEGDDADTSEGYCRSDSDHEGESDDAL